MSSLTWSSFVSPQSGRQMLKCDLRGGPSVVTYCPADWSATGFEKVVRLLEADFAQISETDPAADRAVGGFAPQEGPAIMIRLGYSWGTVSSKTSRPQRDSNPRTRDENLVGDVDDLACFTVEIARLCHLAALGESGVIPGNFLPAEVVGGRFGGQGRRLALGRRLPLLGMAFALLLVGCDRPLCRESAKTIMTDWGGSEAECERGASITVSPSGDRNHAVVTCRCLPTADAGTE